MNPDYAYDQAKKRKRQAEGYRPGLRPMSSTPGLCWYCGEPIMWGRLPDRRWQPLEPEPSNDGAYAILPGKRAIAIPLGATTLPEVERHDAHRCEANG